MPATSVRVLVQGSRNVDVCCVASKGLAAVVGGIEKQQLFDAHSVGGQHRSSG
eukprot:m.642868 g.642868  ORF g.642868 m.642868 type:complete len:53 (+) comp22642_c1_seq10:722-880(+)